MFFPLLESLLHRDIATSKTRIREFLTTDESPRLLYKAFLTIAAQNAPSDNLYEDAVIKTSAYVTIMEGIDKNKIAHITDALVEYLCTMPIEPVDTSVLKPEFASHDVVSVHDLEEALDTGDEKLVFEKIRDLLATMDNKQYFMEIMILFGLKRSLNTALAAVHTSMAIQVMDWKNNFTPFLIHRLVRVVCNDKNRETPAKTDCAVDWDDLFRFAPDTYGLIKICALWRSIHEAGVLRSKTEPWVAHYALRLLDTFPKSTDFPVLDQVLSAEDTIRIKGALQGLPHDSARALDSKIPFVV